MNRLHKAQRDCVSPNTSKRVIIKTDRKSSIDKVMNKSLFPEFHLGSYSTKNVCHSLKKSLLNHKIVNHANDSVAPLDFTAFKKKLIRINAFESDIVPKSSDKAFATTPQKKIGGLFHPRPRMSNLTSVRSTRASLHLPSDTNSTSMPKLLFENSQPTHAAANQPPPDAMNPTTTPETLLQY